MTKTMNCEICNSNKDVENILCLDILTLCLCSECKTIGIEQGAILSVQEQGAILSVQSETNDGDGDGDGDDDGDDNDADECDWYMDWNDRSIDSTRRCCVECKEIVSSFNYYDDEGFICTDCRPWE